MARDCGLYRSDFPLPVDSHLGDEAGESVVGTPFTYQGDALFYHIVVKGVVDNGWFQNNPMLGMPYGLDLRDVPTSDNNLYFLLIKLISLFTSNYSLILNLFSSSVFHSPLQSRSTSRGNSAFLTFRPLYAVCSMRFCRSISFGANTISFFRPITWSRSW